MLCIRLLLKKRIKSTRVIVAIAVITVASLVSVGNSNASFIFYSLVLIVLGVDIDLISLVKSTMWIQVFSCALTVGSSMIGIIANEVSNSYAGGFYRERFSLGYTYTTFFPNYLLSIMIEFYYLKYRKKWKFIDYCLFSLLNIFSYEYTKTRVSFVMIWLIMILAFFKQFKRKKNVIGRVKGFVYRWSFPICAFASLGLTVFYNASNKWMKFLNDVLSQRLRFGQNGLLQWGVSLFGTSVSWDIDASSYNYIDSSYVNILVCYGVIVFFIVVIGFTLSHRAVAKKGNEELCVCLMIWAFRGIIDPQLFLIWFNPFMFIIGKALLANFRGAGVKYVKSDMFLQQSRIA